MTDEIELAEKAMIKTALVGVDDPEIRLNFIRHFEDSVEEFVNLIWKAHRRWKELDSTVRKSEERAHVSSLVYGVINNQLVSMKLLLLGLVIPAGNMQRQVIEGMALTLLVSRRSLGVRQKYIQGKLSSNKSMKALRKYATTLGIDPNALSQLERKGKFYDKFSHPTYMTVAHSMFVKPSQGLGLGGFFDEGKLVIYEKEVRSRVNCAGIFENFIDAVKSNLDLD